MPLIRSPAPCSDLPLPIFFGFYTPGIEPSCGKPAAAKTPENGVGAPPRGVRNRIGAFLPLARRSESVTTPVLVPLSPDGYQMNGLKAVFAAFER
jgi:hypothetical protein